VFICDGSRIHLVRRIGRLKEIHELMHIVRGRHPFGRIGRRCLLTTKKIYLRYHFINIRKQQIILYKKSIAV